jgi:lysozyme family protein
VTDNWALSLSHVLRHEGGYADHPSDPGGITNLGVTKSAWEAHVGHPVADMRALTVADVGPFYKRRYWDKLRCDDLPAGLDYAVFDLGVNSGVGRAARILQQVSGAEVDGMIGKATLRHCAGRSLVDPLCDARLRFLRQLPTFGVFGKGWTNRVADVRARAKQMEAE